ncbi:MAG: DUF4595 domain-containing protein, partial [Muribaculaceae bacterium]|nr:DUF4595 domain-containing protein [Muribaculaceae bacterium]
IGYTTIAFSLISCSNDEPASDSAIEPSIETVFPKGLPASVDGATFTVNEKGQVTKIVDGSDEITFEYGSFSRTTAFNALMKIRDIDDPSYGSDIYMQLNTQGFVTYALQVYLDAEDEEDTWKFEYNPEGQLIRLQRSEGSDDFKITYTDGSITNVIQDQEDGDHWEYTIAYTNTEHPTVIPNKGCIMMFDDFFHIDMDEMGVAYYAGLLGKSSANLPVGYVKSGKEGDSYYTSSQNYHWEFNTDKMPVRFWSGDDQWDAISFAWK